MNDKVVVLKILTGEEVIATVDSNDGKYYKLRALQIRAQGTSSTAPQAGLVPFFIISPDAKCVINKSLILTEIDCPPDVEKSYREATSGIALL